MKKRLLAALVSGAMLMGALAGCGSSTAQTSGGDTAQQDYHIKVILKTLASVRQSCPDHHRSERCLLLRSQHPDP